MAMRIPRTPVVLSIAGALTALAAAPAHAQPPAQTGNCVSYFTTTLADARAAGAVISFGAREMAPFGRNAVSAQAHATLGSCVFDPGDFLP
jgi:hypothetical protein